MQTLKISENYKVFVCCLTYNHERYIIDALNGFSMQQTAFPFVCIIMDDASTDGTPEVIIDWLQRECQMEKAQYYDTELTKTIIVPHCSNVKCTMAVYLLKRNLFHESGTKLSLVSGLLKQSTYVAICDGDDYWIDSQKLQKQADCLDNHPEIDCCIHGYFERKENTFIQKSFCQEERIIPLDEVILRNKFDPAAESIFIRRNAILPAPRFLSVFPIDYSFLICGAIRGGILYLPYEMSTYRVGVEKSICTIMSTNPKTMKGFYLNEIKMLNTLDEYLNFEYHKIIQARILVDAMNFSVTPFETIYYIIKHRSGLNKLPLSQRMKLIFRCIIPQKIGHLILEIARRIQKTKVCKC